MNQIASTFLYTINIISSVSIKSILRLKLTFFFSIKATYLQLSFTGAASKFTFIQVHVVMCLGWSYNCNLSSNNKSQSMCLSENYFLRLVAIQQIVEHLFCARMASKCLQVLNSFDPLNTSMREEQLSSPFYRWKHRDTGR